MACLSALAIDHGETNDLAYLSDLHDELTNVFFSSRATSIKKTIWMKKGQKLQQDNAMLE